MSFPCISVTSPLCAPGSGFDRWGVNPVAFWGLKQILAHDWLMISSNFFLQPQKMLEKLESWKLREWHSRHAAHVELPRARQKNTGSSGSFFYWFEQLGPTISFIKPGKSPCNLYVYHMYVCMYVCMYVRIYTLGGSKISGSYPISSSAHLHKYRLSLIISQCSLINYLLGIPSVACYWSHSHFH